LICLKIINHFRPSDAGKAALQTFKPGEFMTHRPADDDTVIEMGTILSVTRFGDDQQ